MKKEEAQAKEKQDKKILRQTDKIIRDFSEQQAQRHVKEPTEAIFKQIHEKFTLDYGKKVVVNINEEILKELADDI
jgi:hypothetical protein